MDEDEGVKGALRRYGAKRRDRLAADSSVGFRRYSLKLGLTTGFLLFDMLGIPSAFQAFGMVGLTYVVPEVAAIGAAAVAEFWTLYRLK